MKFNLLKPNLRHVILKVLDILYGIDIGRNAKNQIV